MIKVGAFGAKLHDAQISQDAEVDVDDCSFSLKNLGDEMDPKP